MYTYICIAVGDGPIVVSSPKFLSVSEAVSRWRRRRGRRSEPPKGLTAFNTNTGISVPLLRVRPNTSAEAARDYLRRGGNG